MVTGQELKAFAEEHDFLLPPYRDFDEWAKDLNANGGRCPCHPNDRMCPCQESINEIANAPTDDLACCTCRFYCSERYITHWEESWRAQGLIAKKELPKEKRTPTNPDIIMILDVLEKAKKKLLKDDPTSSMEILQDKVEYEEQNGHCDACKLYMETEAARHMLLIKEFAINMPGYEKDKKRAIEQLDELIDLYEKVDESLDTDVVETPRKGDLSETHRDGYHECLSKALNHPTLKARVSASTNRFKVANLFCRGKTATLTEAIEFFEKERA